MTRLDRLAEAVRPLYETDDPAHDWAHVRRVVANCERLLAAETGDHDILIAAALLHDIVNLPKDHPRRKEASAMSARAARRYLEAEFSPAEIEAICAAVEEHSFSAGHRPSRPESALLQDADRLDATGAIGFMRLVATGAAMKSPFYQAERPFDPERTREHRFVVDHFELKVARLPELMNTETGRRVATARVEFMRETFARLGRELDGEC